MAEGDGVAVAVGVEVGTSVAVGFGVSVDRIDTDGVCVAVGGASVGAGVEAGSLSALHATNNTADITAIGPTTRREKVVIPSRIQDSFGRLETARSHCTRRHVRGMIQASVAQG